MNYTASATITGTETIGDEIDIFYAYHKDLYSDDGEQLTDVNKKAILRDAGDGKYRIMEIVEATGENAPKAADTEAAVTSETAADATAAGNVRDLYEGVLTDVQNGAYDFPQNRGSSHFQYFVADINGDGIQELGVGPVMEDSAFLEYDLKIFTCTPSDNGYQLTEVQGDQFVDNLYIAGDGNGLFEVMLSRGTGEAEAHRITISDGSLIMGGAEQNLQFGEASFTDFVDSNPFIEWLDVTDLSALDTLQ